MIKMMIDTFLFAGLMNILIKRRRNLKLASGIFNRIYDTFVKAAIRNFLNEIEPLLLVAAWLMTLLTTSVAG